MGSVIIILKRKFLQVFEQILADIKNNILSNLRHDTGAEGGKKDADGVACNKDQNKCKQKLLIFVWNCHIQCSLGNDRGKESRDGTDCT